MLVEIWSDIACPWCYIGKHRFETALADFEHAGEVEVRWRSFELDPSAPASLEGPRVERLAAKYGLSVEQAREAEQRLVDLAATDGLEMRFDIARSANTFDAHRLVAMAQEAGLGAAMKERLLRAHFAEGELVSDRDTLVRLAVEVGLDGDGVHEMLASGAYAQEVRDDERTAADLGIRGVPTFVIDRAIGVSGAQPPAELLALLQQGWQARSAAVGAR